jgi:uncharacterized damage-inducible protein DinB
MFTQAGIRTLHGWTHQRLDLLLDHADTLTPEQFVTKLPGFGMGSVRDQLMHILRCEQGWIGRLQYLPVKEMECEEHPTIKQIRETKARIMAGTNAYLDQLSEAQLNTELTRRPDGWGGSLRSPAFTLHHILTHAFHHKGQIVAMFRLLGRPIGDTDLQN